MVGPSVCMQQKDFSGLNLNSSWQSHEPCWFVLPLKRRKRLAHDLIYTFAPHASLVLHDITDCPKFFFF